MNDEPLELCTPEQLLTNLYESRTERLKQMKRLALMEEMEKQIAEELIKRKIVKVQGWVIDRRTTDEPFVQDWPSLIQYIKDTGSVDLLERRLLKSGAKARWDENVAIPGVKKIEKTTLKVEKL